MRADRAEAFHAHATSAAPRMGPPGTTFTPMPDHHIPVRGRGVLLDRGGTGGDMVKLIQYATIVFEAYSTHDYD